METGGREVFVWQAEVCKALANPKRLEIIHALAVGGRLCAAELLSAAELSKTNLSQHMRVLRSAGIVEAEREGVQVCYRLSSPKVGAACETLREFLAERAGRQHGRLAGGAAKRLGR
jgi:ArsR family transcriptional regulator